MPALTAISGMRVALAKANPEDAHVESVAIKEREYTFTVYDPVSKQRSKKVTLGPAPGDDLLKMLEDKKVKLQFEKEESSPFWSSALITILLLTGCTLSTDHFYLFPCDQPNAIIDRTVEAASALGIRFHPTRGSMSRGVSKGGLPPDDVVQDEATILKDCERFAAAYHDLEASLGARGLPVAIRSSSTREDAPGRPPRPP